jgi:hypothetical protein
MEMGEKFSQMVLLGVPGKAKASLWQNYQSGRHPLKPTAIMATATTIIRKATKTPTRSSSLMRIIDGPA